MLTKQEFFLVIELPVLFIDYEIASYDFIDIKKRNTYHCLCRKSRIIKYGSVKSCIGYCVRDHYRFACLRDRSLYTDTVLDTYIGYIDGTNVKDRSKSVRLFIKKPYGSRFTFQLVRDYLKSSRQSILKAINLEKLLYDPER